MKSHRAHRSLRWAAVYVLVAVTAAAGGLVLRSAAVKAQPQQVARIEPAPAPVHKAIVGPEDPLITLLRSATVLAPRSHGDLTLFPVTVSYAADFGPVLTMDEGLNRGLLAIKEVGAGSVNELNAANLSDSYVFLMASEMVGGAKQDRTIGEDVLLAPHTTVRLPVYCVEAHRWSAAPPDEGFYAPAAALTAPVRRAARLQRDQSAVWSEVAREQARLEAPSATGALKSVYESADVQARLKPYTEALANVPGAAPNVIGVVVAAGGRIVCADLFYRPDLFRRLWPKLLASYAADVLGKPSGRKPVTIGDAEGFLGRLYHAQRRRESTPGVGYGTRLSGAGVSGSALVYQRSVVHLEVFPGVEILPEPVEVRPLDLNFRRQRLEGPGE